MSRKKARLSHYKQRPVLSDTLPYEVPPSFSNRHFYDFLVSNEVNVVDGYLRWKADDGRLDNLIRLLFGIPWNEAISDDTVTAWGKTRSVRQVPFEACDMITIPFVFQIAHKETEARRLAVPHPRNQFGVAIFYNRYNELIIYVARQSPFSIRYPASVAKVSFYNDKTHLTKLSESQDIVEEYEKEYEKMGSFFSYGSYSNVYKFYESYKYHNSEKKYNKLLKLDISKCFDSIYTHSLTWAVLGKEATKFNLSASRTTFSGRFDTLMQQLNHNETNGIVIGPEFSRIFSELILQSVDNRLECALLNKHDRQHKRDYEIFRYVDDYFIFYNDEETAHLVVENLEHILGEFKLHLNTSKSQVYEKPIITELTIAKDRLAQLLSDFLNAELTETEHPTDQTESAKKFTISINASRLIIKFKTIILEARVEYKSVLNYSFAVIEGRIIRILDYYLEAHPDLRSPDQLLRVFMAVVEFCFFVYSASPRVNHTIRLCRILMRMIKFLDSNDFGFDRKHQLYKFICDNIAHQMNKNKVSEFREIETLYLLIALRSLGKNYLLDEDTLRKYLGVKIDSQGAYYREPFLNHFSITVCLLYIKDKVRYSSLRAFLEEHIISKVYSRIAHLTSDSEILILLLDIIACPYVTTRAKERLVQMFGVNPEELPTIQSANRQWFTAWEDFDFAGELDAKLNRLVY